MKKDRKRLVLHRDTVRILSAPAMEQAAGGAVGTHQSCTCFISCVVTGCGNSCVPSCFNSICFAC